VSEPAGRSNFDGKRLRLVEVILDRESLTDRFDHPEDLCLGQSVAEEMRSPAVVERHGIPASTLTAHQVGSPDRPQVPDFLKLECLRSAPAGELSAQLEPFFINDDGFTLGQATE
jgi:hypothetical protein